MKVHEPFRADISFTGIHNTLYLRACAKFDRWVRDLCCAVKFRASALSRYMQDSTSLAEGKDEKLRLLLEEKELA